MPSQVFTKFKVGISKGASSFGLKVEGNTVHFTELKRIIRDFSKLCGLTRSETKEAFKKEMKGKKAGWRAELIVSEEKPFSVSYDEK